MGKTIVARWQDWSGTGAEHAVVRVEDSSISVDSVVLSANDGAPFAVRYRLQCHASWAMRRAEIEIVGTERKIELACDGQGNGAIHRAVALLTSMARSISICQ